MPTGDTLELKDGRPVEYLVHEASDVTFYLSSDSVIPTFPHRAARIVAQLDHGELSEFDRLGSTIGGMMLFPSYKVDGKMTINGARGMHPRIADRFDLTVECIRRHYAGESSPLSAALARYADFFALFGDFSGYIDFFLLQDLIDDGAVRFALRFDDFATPSVPPGPCRVPRVHVQKHGVPGRTERADREVHSTHGRSALTTLPMRAATAGTSVAHGHSHPADRRHARSLPC